MLMDIDNYYNMLTLCINGAFKWTVNNVEIEPYFAYHIISRLLNEASVVGRAKNTHLIIYNIERKDKDNESVIL